MASTLDPNLFGKTMSQSLPSREHALFKSMLKLLDSKQHKKALKITDTILKKYPDHGETLAVKAFALRSQFPEKKEESYELVRKGLQHDIKSYVCWHVYGMLKKADRDYVEAIKCYRFALKADEKNYGLLSELANLLIQVRDTKAYVDLRQTLLSLKPNNRNNWIALIVAHHLVKDHETALQILEKFEGAIGQNHEPYEHGELLLFKNLILEEGGKLEEALKHLEKSESQIPDKIYVKEKRAFLLKNLGRNEDAVAEYKALIKINPENYKYFAALQEAVLSRTGAGSLSGSDRERLQAVYLELQKDSPKATAPVRIPLDFLEGEQFRDALDHYVRERLSQGKPALFTELKPLYNNEEKVGIIEELFESYVSTLRDTSKFPPFKGEEKQESAKEGPSSLLFSLFFLAQHYDHRGEVTKALQFIDEAIEHTPTLINLYIAKGRIYKHAGDLVTASAFLEKARELDLADRYLNTKSTRFLLRADLRTQADAVISHFTKEGTSAVHNLYDMQASWYELELGDSYLRAGMLSQALVQYTNVEKHFSDFVDDQYDFHSYCLRKMTLRAYLQLLQWEDNVHSHAFLFRAYCGIITCYLGMHKNSTTPNKGDQDDADLASLSEEERKKEMRKRRRARARANKDTTGKKEAEETSPTSPATVSDPLGEASKYVNKLCTSSADRKEAHLLAFAVYFARRKYLLALQALKHSISLDANSPQVHRNLVTFYDEVGREAANISDVVMKVINAEKETLLPSSLVEYNAAFLSKNSHSLPHRVAAASMQWLLSGKKEEEGHKAADLILQSSLTPSPKLEDAVSAYEELLNLKEDEAAKEFKQKCKDTFTLSTFFGAQPLPVQVAPSEEAEGGAQAAQQV